MINRNNLSVKMLLAALASLFFIGSQSCAQSPAFSYKSIPADLTSKHNSAAGSNTIPAGVIDLTSSLPQGYVKDGSQDYTAALQAALKPGGSYKFPAFPILINDKGLKIGSNTSIYFPQGAALLLKPSSKGNYQMLVIHNAENVKINNAVLTGDRLNHVGGAGEWGMGISIRGSKNVTINSPTINNCWGDGIYVGAISNTISRNVEINNAMLDNNRRNGISIISVIGLKINNPLISNTNGTKPMAGICFEPNNNDDFLDTVSITNPITFNNAEWGVIFTLNHMIGASGKPINITIQNQLDRGSKVGMCYRNFKTSYAGGKPLTGQINIINPTWQDNASVPFLGGRSYGYSPRVVIKGYKVSDKSAARTNALHMSNTIKYLSTDPLIKFEN